MKPLAVFISYRREDAAGYAGRLADTLRHALGAQGEILRDVDSMIAPGADFLAVINRSIDRADAFLAVIGPRWLTVANAEGERRLDTEDDVVRMEILAALESGIPVIPILIDHAEMPVPSELPTALAALSGRNAIELTDARWSEDTARLVEALTAATKPADSTASLPHPAHPLLGRDRELVEVGELLASSVGLLTLTGPGGIGKTSFALEAARSAADHYERILYCDLTVVDEPELVLPALAREAGIDEPDAARLAEALGRAIGDSPTLFVLDNFEHVLAAAPAIAKLLAAAPGASALVTSRAPLRVSGEREYPIPPLSQVAAVALFEERARAVRPDLDLDGDEAAAVIEICARLDGLPLAIELAAARVRLLSPRAMLGHLEKRLSLLTHGAQDRPERQQTVRATIDWSYRLLSEADRTLLARMSVFAGGGTLAAIQAICVPDADELEVLDQVQRLAENSLIVADVDAGGNQRLRMLELIREFTREQVAGEGETADLACKHADYYAGLGRQYGPMLQSEEQADGLAFFDAEYPNLTEALGWTRDSGEGDLELELLDWLGDYWYFRGFYAEPWLWFEHGLTVDDASPSRRAAILRGAGGLRVRMDDNAGARELFVASLEIYEELEDANGMVRALSGLEGCLARMGEYDLAEQAGSRAIEIVRSLGDERRLAFAVSNAGYTALQRGHSDAARAFFEEALELAEKVQDAEAISLAQQNLGLLLVFTGELGRAEELSALGLQGALELQEHLGILAGLVALAAIRSQRDDLAGAAQVLGLIDSELMTRNYALDPVEARLRSETVELLENTLDNEARKAAAVAGAELELSSAAAEIAQQSLGKPTGSD